MCVRYCAALLSFILLTAAWHCWIYADENSVGMGAALFLRHKAAAFAHLSHSHAGLALSCLVCFLLDGCSRLCMKACNGMKPFARISYFQHSNLLSRRRGLVAVGTALGSAKMQAGRVAGRKLWPAQKYVVCILLCALLACMVPDAGARASFGR